MKTNISTKKESLWKLSKIVSTLLVILLFSFAGISLAYAEACPSDLTVFTTPAQFVVEDINSQIKLEIKSPESPLDVWKQYAKAIISLPNQLVNLTDASKKLVGFKETTSSWHINSTIAGNYTINITVINDLNAICMLTKDIIVLNQSNLSNNITIDNSTILEINEINLGWDVPLDNNESMLPKTKTPLTITAFLDNVNNSITSNNTQDNTYLLDFIAPEKEGIYNYRLEFLQDNETKTYTDFDIETSSLDFELQKPATARENNELKLKIKNKRQSEVNGTISFYLNKNGTTIQRGIQNFTVGTTEKYVNISLSDLKAEDTVYDLLIDIVYLNSKKTIAEQIISNHAPRLETINDIVVTELDLINVTPVAFDEDGDTLNITISSPVGNDGVWQTTLNNSGNYTLVISASDGYTTTEQNISLIVNSYIDPATLHAPKIYMPDIITVFEYEIVNITINATDPDDDILIYSINDSRFMQINNVFTWQTNYGSAGTYNVKVIVSDGSFNATKIVTIIVNNVNRAPILITIDNITVNENQLITITVLASDPEGTALTYSINDSRFAQNNNIFTWQTNLTDAGDYNLKVTVNDRQLTAMQQLKVTVLNKGVAPILSPIQDIIVSEGDKIELLPTYIDYNKENVGLSIDNNNFNYDNDRFIWQTRKGDGGLYNVKVTATGNYGNDSKTFMLRIKATNSAPTIQPIQAINAIERQLINFTLTANDQDNDALTYEINNREFRVTNNNFIWQAKPGNHTFTISVSDGKDKSTTDVKINVLPKYCNIIKCESYCDKYTYNSAQCSNDVIFRTSSYGSYDPNEWIAVDLGSGLQGYKYKQQISIDNCKTLKNITTTPQGYLIYKYTNGIVLDLINDCNRLFYYELSNDNSIPSNNTQLHDYTATNREKVQGCSYKQYASSQMCVKRENRAPVILDIPNITVTEGSDVKIIVNASDYENNALSYTISDNRFTQFHNIFTWLTNYRDSGIYKYTITVKDSLTGISLNSIQKDFYVEVKDVQCGGVTCNPYCQSTTRYYNGRCNTGTETCSYDMQYNSEMCGYVNTAPLIKAIVPTTVTETNLAILNIEPLEEGVNVIITNNNFIKQNATYFTWQTTYQDAGSYEVEVVATKDNKIDSKLVNITVNNKNRQPVYNGGLPNTLSSLEETPINLDLASIFSDPDNDKLTYKIDNINFSIENLANNRINLLPIKDYYGRADIIITADDGNNGNASSSLISMTVINTPEIEPTNNVIEEYQYHADETIDFGFKINDIMPINNCSLIINNVNANNPIIQTKNNLNNFNNNIISYDDGSSEDKYRIGLYWVSADKLFANVGSVYGIILDVGYYAQYPSDKIINLSINGINVYNITRREVESSCGRNRNCILTVLFDQPIAVNDNATISLYSEYESVDHFKLGVDKNTVLNLSSNMQQGIIKGEYILRLIIGSNVIKFRQQLSRGEYTWHGECYNKENSHKKTPASNLHVVNSIPTYPKKLLPESGTFKDKIDIECGESYDGDNDQLSYYIWYKRSDLRDGDWQILATNDQDGLTALNITQMPASASLRIKCMATDGLINGTTKDVGWLKVGH